MCGKQLILHTGQNSPLFVIVLLEYERSCAHMQVEHSWKENTAPGHRVTNTETPAWPWYSGIPSAEGKSAEPRNTSLTPFHHMLRQQWSHL
jgi:hypothetical protein